MFRFAPLVGFATAISDETSLIQGLKPQPVAQKEDKSKAISNLLQSATQMLKNGATPDVVDFATATLTEITGTVLPAIQDAHNADQQLVDSTFTMFETALAELEAGTRRITTAHNAERALSAQHKACRAQEEVACENKRECDYDLWAQWKRFVDEESELRQLSLQIETHFCAEDANGTTWNFRSHSAEVLFPPWISQKPLVEQWELAYDHMVPTCENLFTVLDEKTAECDALQLALERAACTHGNTVTEVRNLFAESWEIASITYQRIMDEVHCLEIDRWKEWRTLASVQCLLDRTTERNGRPCDEQTGEIDRELETCETIQVDTSIDLLRITYHVVPPFPPFCATPPWEWSEGYPSPNPGRCVPVPPQVPCSAGYIAQEYAELWVPPQSPFHSPSEHLEHESHNGPAWANMIGGHTEDGNSHCNPRPDCEVCQTEEESTHCGNVYGSNTPSVVYPTPEHECSSATALQMQEGTFDGLGDGHWDRDYMIMPYGAANCPEGKRITTYAECEAAHAALGLEVNPVWTGHYDQIPGYCSTREPDSHGGHHFHFNTLATGISRSDLAPVCRF